MQYDASKMILVNLDICGCHRGCVGLIQNSEPPFSNPNPKRFEKSKISNVEKSASYLGIGTSDRKLNGKFMINDT